MIEDLLPHPRLLPLGGGGSYLHHLELFSHRHPEFDSESPCFGVL